MKVLTLGYIRYAYPHGIHTLADFAAFINNSERAFIPLQQFGERNCVFPFLVEEDKKTVYVNFKTVPTIYEEEVTVLSREEYDRRLEKVVLEKCVECVNYKEDSEDNMRGHRDKLCLDGTCYEFEKIAQAE
ncbi:MAG: hypothetical protein FWE69_07375 [Clostridiales bacterium]|nr:hypothetical protein [Clostridiales bacterium]